MYSGKRQVSCYYLANVRSGLTHGRSETVLTFDCEYDNVNLCTVSFVVSFSCASICLLHTDVQPLAGGHWDGTSAVVRPDLSTRTQDSNHCIAELSTKQPLYQGIHVCATVIVTKSVLDKIIILFFNLQTAFSCQQRRHKCPFSRFLFLLMIMSALFDVCVIVISFLTNTGNVCFR